MVIALIQKLRHLLTWGCLGRSTKTTRAIDPSFGVLDWCASNEHIFMYHEGTPWICQLFTQRIGQTKHRHQQRRFWSIRIHVLTILRLTERKWSFFNIFRSHESDLPLTSSKQRCCTELKWNLLVTTGFIDLRVADGFVRHCSWTYVRLALLFCFLPFSLYSLECSQK